MDEGCLFQIIIYVGIFMAIVAAIAAAVSAIAICGSAYGTYKAAVCYATAIKRTYGSDENYEAGAGMKAIVIGAIILLVFLLFCLFSLATRSAYYYYY